MHVKEKKKSVKGRFVSSVRVKKRFWCAWGNRAAWFGPKGVVVGDERAWAVALGVKWV